MKIMKRYISFTVTFSLLAAVLYTSGQTTGKYHIQTKNYINEVQEPGGLPENGEDYLETYTYLDGLGRTLQTVSKKLSPDQKDMVGFHVYDNYGREPKVYLAYADNSIDGSFKTNVVTKQSDFYTNAMKVAHTNFPYTKKTYDGAGRIIKHGAPGEPWQPENHPIEFDFTFNTGQENIRKWELSANGLYCYSTSIYNSNELTIDITTNENNKTVKSYADRNGLLIASEKEDNLKTYYIYDDFERLIIKIPPKAIEQMENTGTWNTSSLNEDLIYRSLYDGKNRIYRKYIPGRDFIEFAYDNLDRIILTQDGNLRLQDKCNFIKYDILGRVVMSGICDDPNSGGLITLQEAVDNHYATSEGNNYEDYVGVSPTYEHGYTNHSFPILTTNDEVLTVSYYDSYDFTPAGFRNEYEEIGGFENEQSTRNRGRRTGGKIKILDNTNTWLYNVIFYDDRGRIIQTFGHNQFQNNNSCDEMTFQYDFTGKVIKSRHVQIAIIDETGQVHWIEKRYIYDHAGRLLNEYQSVNGQSEVMIKQLQYNELGQVVEKNLHSTDQGSSFLQSVDYKYNIRGWLTHINQANLGNNMHYIPNDDNLAELEVVNALEIENIGIKITHIEDPRSENNRLEIAITDNKQVELEKETSGEVREVEGGETTIYTAYRSVQVDSMAYYTLYVLDQQEYDIDFAEMRIDESTSMMDVVVQIDEFVQNQLPQQDVEEPDQISELSLFVMMHVLNSLGISYINEDGSDLFGMDILYQQGFTALGGTPQFNGVISGIKWQVNGNNPGMRGYGFEYDDLYQLTDANYAKQGQAYNWNDEEDRYSVNNIQYDFNGNITNIERKGITGYEGGQYIYGLMDDLQYSYDGNQLKSVNDIIPDPAFTGNDFRDNYFTGSIEYTYDANGNMVSDANKGITVTYNHMNLPEEIDFVTGNKIKYLYTATGAKIKKTVETNSSISNVHYAGNIVYNGNELQHIVSSEGQVVKDGNTYKYQYFLRDHLGNVRVVFGEDGGGDAEILQEDHYYPFGLTYMGDLNYNYGTEENKYLYQGKELQDDHNLQWHDFGARMYDAQLGRWHCPDPLLQFASPYLAMGNSPVNGTDPSGMWFDRIKGMSSRGLALYRYMNFMRGKGYSWDGKLHQWGKSIAVPLCVSMGSASGYTAAMVTRRWQTEMKAMADAWRTLKWWAMNKEKQQKIRNAILEGNQDVILAEMDPNMSADEFIAEMDALLELHGSTGMNYESGTGSDGDEDGGQDGAGGIVYYVLEGNGAGHALAYIPSTNTIYEVHFTADYDLKNYTYFEPKAWGYKYTGTDELLAYETDLFQNSQGGRSTLHFSPVYVADIQGAINYYEGYNNNSFPYTIPAKNCKNFVLHGLWEGGAKWTSWLNSTNPVPSWWFGEYTFTYP